MASKPIYLVSAENLSSDSCHWKQHWTKLICEPYGLECKDWSNMAIENSGFGCFGLDQILYMKLCTGPKFPAILEADGFFARIKPHKSE
jgi:hypothetical protein